MIYDMAAALAQQQTAELAVSFAAVVDRVCGEEHLRRCRLGAQRVRSSLFAR
jgi:hypothetical protein